MDDRRWKPLQVPQMFGPLHFDAGLQDELPVFHRVFFEPDPLLLMRKLKQKVPPRPRLFLF